MSYLKKILFVLFVIAACLTTVDAQNYQDTIRLKLEAIAAASDLPGFGVAVVRKDKILYKNGFGYADIENKKNARP